MSVRIFLVILTLAAGIAHAEVLPPAVADLQARVAETEKRLGEVKQQLDEAKARYVTLDGRLHALVGVLLRSRGYPEGFWVTRSVVTNQPGAAGVMGVVLRQSVEELASAQARATVLGSLYNRMNTQMAEVREVQAAFADARGRLLAQERDVLRAAGVKADALSAALAAELGSAQVGLAADEVAVTVVNNIPTVKEGKIEVAKGPVWPVAGRVARPFHTGDGAMSEGVLLKTKPGADVKAPLGGEVLYAGPFRQFGGLVIVKADSGENILLGGMRVLHVNRGNRVATGDVIGRVGDDGLVYWEVRRRGREIDPLRLVKGRG